MLLQFCQSSVAQTSLRQAVSAFKKDNIVNATVHNNKTDKSEVTTSGDSSIDTIYCTRTKKQHGWFAPMDTISRDAASHRWMSCRFTKKNKAGHWEKMETVDALGNYVEGAMMPYILKLGTAVESDKGANEKWVDKLKTTCICEFISDFNGRNIVQEIAKDKQGNIVYTYSRVPVGNNQYIGSYRDHHGLPAEMRQEKGYTYGTLVLITEDQWGNDSVIQYIDSKGLPKLNSDSVAMEVYICDKDGHLLKQQSRDIDGNLTIDNWGNCGVEYKWNAEHQIESATYMDDNWQPMRMPALRGTDGRENVYKTLYEYDKYGRQIKEWYVKPDGTPDVNALGTHLIEQKYDSLGNTIATHGYDKEGNHSPISNSMAVTMLCTYDKRGHATNVVFLDSNDQPCSTDGYSSRVHFEYDDAGNQIKVEQYSVKNGKERIYYKNVKERTYEYTQWDDNSYRKDSLDSKGRLKSVMFFNANGQLEMNGGRATELYTYIDKDKSSLSTECDFDINGEPIDVNGTHKTVILADSLNWTKTWWKYNAQGILTETFIQRYDDNFENVLAQDDANEMGILSRSGGSSSVRYYHSNVAYRVDGGYAGFYARDEFDEPDYITSPSNIYYYQKWFSNASIAYYDVKNEPIEDNKFFRDGLPKVMTIEVIDSAGYKYGFKDNDIILLYGDYCVDLDTTVSYMKFRQDWTLRTVLDAKKTKRMVVFRVTDAAKNEYGLYEILDLSGCCSDMGFITHIRYLTDKQVNRIRKAIGDNISGSTPLLAYADFKKPNYINGSNYVIMAYTEMYRIYRNNPYPKQVTDPAILLGACIKDRGIKWTVENGEDIKNFNDMLSSRYEKGMLYPTQDFYLTKDATNIIHLGLDERAVSTNWFDCYISDEDYDNLISLYQNTCNIINTELQTSTSKYKKNIEGCWTSENANTDNMQQQIYFHFRKDGTFAGKIENFGMIEYNDANAIFKKERWLEGKWENGGNWIFFYVENKDSLITCVDAMGLPDEETRQEAIKFVNAQLQNNPESYSSKISMSSPNIHGDFYITSISKKNIGLVTSFGDTINVVKTKKIPSDLKVTSNNTKGKKKRLTIDESSPLIGNWDCQIPGLDNSYVEFCLEANGHLGIEMSAIYSQELNDTCSVSIIVDLNIEGEWESSSCGFIMDIDPSNLRIGLSYSVKGVEEERKPTIISMLKEEIEPQKKEFGLSLLNGFGKEMEVTEIDSVKMVINGNTLYRIPNERSIVVGRVEGNSGYFVENGYRGAFVILEWGDWNCKQSIDEYVEEFSKQKEKDKHIILLPVESEYDKDVFKEIIEINCPKGQLGLRVMDYNVSKNYYKNNILSRYRDYVLQKR